MRSGRSPAGEHDGLRALPGLPGDARHVREVRAPLPAVQPVLPELAHAHALRVHPTYIAVGLCVHAMAKKTALLCPNLLSCWTIGLLCRSVSSQNQSTGSLWPWSIPLLQHRPGYRVTGMTGWFCNTDDIMHRREVQRHAESYHIAPGSGARSGACARTCPRGSASGGMGPKWSPGTVTMMRPDAAFARPARTARSVVKASSGRSACAMCCAGRRQRTGSNVRNIPLRRSAAQCPHDAPKASVGP